MVISQLMYYQPLLTITKSLKYMIIKKINFNSPTTSNSLFLLLFQRNFQIVIIVKKNPTQASTNKL